MSIEEIITSLKSTLKDKVLTADNTEAVSLVDKGLDNILEEHAKTTKELSATKDKLVDVVKNTSFSTPASKGVSSDVGETEALTLDEILEKELQKIEKEGK